MRLREDNLLQSEKPNTCRHTGRREGDTGPEGSSAMTSAADRWSWVEPAVWSKRMLTALEEGVKGGRWYSLMDKVYLPANLRASFAKVRANGGAAGVDRVTVDAFEERLDKELDKLQHQLSNGSYGPSATKRVYIPKPGSTEKRPLGIPTVRDRVVQGAIRQVLEPIYERDFYRHSYGFRPGRGCKPALSRVWQELCRGKTWVVDADIKGYFDNIAHDRLMARMREKVTDQKLLALVERFLTQGIVEGSGLEQWTPDTGTPQGAVLSPLLANIYLDSFDHMMEEAGYSMVRYADDFVVLCRSEEEARQALDRIRAWMESADLTLHPEKTRIVDAKQRGGFEFLGFHFERGMQWPRKKSVQKLKDTVRAKTRRCNRYSMAQIIEQLNPVLRGWAAYFKVGHFTTFPRLDGWIRMRLRSILRKRCGLRGRGRGRDHQRWQDSYFHERGLFSLVEAHASCRQSTRW